MEETQKKLDKALKRNTGAPVQPTATVTKAQSNELQVDESISETDENIEE